MTPKEKAEQLYKRFQDSLPNAVEIDKLAIQDCALIAVEEIIAAIPTQPSANETERIDAIMYWIAVKQEIEKL